MNYDLLIEKGPILNECIRTMNAKINPKLKKKCPKILKDTQGIYMSQSGYYRITMFTNDPMTKEDYYEVAVLQESTKKG